MAQDEGQEKTEKATGRKLSKLRQEGSVAKSQEIISFAIFSSGMIIIYLFRGYIGGNLFRITESMFSSLDTLEINSSVIQLYIAKAALFFFITMAPILLGLVIFALAANIGQVGFKISPKALKPKFNKFNIVSGIKRIFFSSKSYVEALKSFLKLILVSILTYMILDDLILNSTQLVSFTVTEILSHMVEGALSLVWKVALLYAVLAIGDFVFQRYKFNKDNMMTKQEVKEENKQTEGDPLIKSKIKSKQFEAARSRMMQEIPTADVVVTNPTHFAVAVKYDPLKGSAPIVVAKGVDTLAQKIKKIATENNVPLHEDRQLARALYKLCDVGDSIPEQLYKAVAKILAYIYNLKKSNKKSIV